MASDGFQDDVQIHVSITHLKNRLPSHAVQRLDHTMPVLPNKLTDQFRTTAYHHRHTTLRKVVNKKLLVGVTQALRTIDYQGSGFFRQLQHVGCVDIVHIKWRVAPHQYYIELIQRSAADRRQTEPVSCVIANFELLHSGKHPAVFGNQVSWLHVVQRVATSLRFQQHRKSRVLVRFDIADGVHNHTGFQYFGICIISCRHELSFSVVPYYHALADMIPAIQNAPIAKYLGPQ